MGEMRIEMPVDFCNRHVVLKDLRIHRFSYYERLCFVNKRNVKNCFVLM